MQAVSSLQACRRVYQIDPLPAERASAIRRHQEIAASAEMRTPGGGPAAERKH
ncbi:hypothetical protein ASZ90_010552 [hydrocarbon metagenome]|uniref:Uncharacterized protein n=1 Tax=hydrocarbon metagenome TaxID=938273 RepID=A0A0W8FFM5_9ZZZZ